MHIGEPNCELIKIVRPVLAEVPDHELRDSLSSSFEAERHSLITIEECFSRLTARRPSRAALMHFFQSWSQTNNSAMSVAGLANRVTLRARAMEDDAIQLKYYRVTGSLHRITDEDLGVGGGTVHSDLYYRMATSLCGDDSWQLKKYCLEAASTFRNSLYAKRLKDPDIMNGLLHTLIHEIYTHGEVEYISALCHDWLKTHYDFTGLESRRVLSWVTVHTGGTESNHFRHALEALRYYTDAAGASVDHAAAVELFRTYLREKGEVMHHLIPMFAPDREVALVSGLSASDATGSHAHPLGGTA